MSGCNATGNWTVLLAEDNENDIRLIQRVFKKSSLHCNIQITRDGAEAIAYLKGEYPYDDRAAYPLPLLVLLDLKMPCVDGFEVLAVAKSAPALRRIPIVVLTTSNEAVDINRCYDLGANSYLVKPVIFEEFTRVIFTVEEYWLAMNAASLTSVAG